MMNLAAVLPLLTQAAGPIAKEVLGTGSGEKNVPSRSRLTNPFPGIEAQVQMAQTEMNAPQFWRPPPVNWEKAALVAVSGLLLGYIFGRHLK